MVAVPIGTVIHQATFGAGRMRVGRSDRSSVPFT